MRSAFMCLLLFLGLCVSGVFQAAHAYNFDVRHIPNIPEFPLLAQEEFEAATDLVSEDPVGDDTFAYEVRIPKEWTKSDDGGLGSISISRQIIGEVARFYSPPMLDVRSFLSLKVLQLKEMITTRNWFLHHLLTNGYTLEGLREIDENRVEALFVVVDRDGTTYRVRVVAIKNGQRVALAMYYVPYEHWEKQKVMQAMVVDSFRLLSQRVDVFDHADIFTFLDIIQFKYPLTWSLRAPDIKSLDRMKALIINKTSLGASNGWIEVRLVSREVGTTIQDEVKTLREDYEKNDFIFGDFIETIEGYEFNRFMEFGVVELYELRPKDSIYLSYELWSAILQDADYYCFVTMVSPSRKADFYAWALNSEVFQMVAESLGPFEEGEYEEYIVKEAEKRMRESQER